MSKLLRASTRVLAEQTKKHDNFLPNEMTMLYMSTIRTIYNPDTRYRMKFHWIDTNVTSLITITSMSNIEQWLMLRKKSVEINYIMIIRII